MIEHSQEGICTLAPDRPRQDVGICTACWEQGLFETVIAEISRRPREKQWPGKTGPKPRWTS